MPIRIRDLKNGDVLLCYGWNRVAVGQGILKTFNRLTLGSVKTGAELVRAVPNAMLHGANGRMPRAPVIFDLNDPVGIGEGSASCNHALIAIKGGSEVAHATGSGCVYGDLELYLNAHTGTVCAFRMNPQTDETKAIAVGAATTAATWASNVFDASSAPSYSVTKALSAAFSSHSYGPAASRRAAFYRKHKATEGGPPSEATIQILRRSGKKEWFCSMFVIAALQAAMEGDAQCRRYLALDARNTTPMILDGYLRGSMSWRFLGAVTLTGT